MFKKLVLVAAIIVLGGVLVWSKFNTNAVKPSSTVVSNKPQITDQPQPALLNGMLEQVKLSNVTFHVHEDTQTDFKTFTTNNGVFSFEYPSYMYVKELTPDKGVDQTRASSLMMTNNPDDFKKADGLETCLQTALTKAGQVCDENWNSGIMSVYLSAPAQLGTVFPTEQVLNTYQVGSLKDSYIKDNYTALREKIEGFDTQTTITYNPSYLDVSYTLLADNNSFLVAIRGNQDWYPNVWPFKPTLLKLTQTLKKIK